MPKKLKVPRFSLMRGRIRPSWNKQNLYNLAKRAPARTSNRTMYQQKWDAKQETRAYHGDHLTERRFQGLFSPALRGVLDLGADAQAEGAEDVPLGLQTFATLERRLDVALFRAMFAVSPQQARQFVRQGHVKVNGAKMLHAFYTLKPGDVFSVTPECALRAVGRVKPSREFSEKVTAAEVARYEEFVGEARANPRGTFERKFAPMAVDEVPDAEAAYAVVKAQALGRVAGVRAAELAAFDAAKAEHTAAVEADLAAAAETYGKTNKVAAVAGVDTAALVLEYLAAEHGAERVYGVPAEGETLPEVREAAAIVADVVACRRRAVEAEADAVERVCTLPAGEYDAGWYLPYEAKYQGVRYPWTNVIPAAAEAAEAEAEAAAAEATADDAADDAALDDTVDDVVPTNPSFGLADPSKSYFTPWVPRPFFGPWAIVPAHIEVSYKTCHAVYLRDPVARKGNSEVISPYGINSHEKSYMFYVRKRM
ncbi:mitochondrial 37S ribosomal protein uS4m, partial [Dipodascopsis tothii]|uniref:mitochondrial 37S ribosomal protein uS4m n=1 Tax=Dipodascopsis tothii TaxID=44089 RepID=UPI0034CD3ECA